ncbi:DMT family transporter [Iamia majanohamensis]|uniref:DMT family transporter n=1 Tax=Iamia majanohamensis TaxID=467976 RepID=A0AAE9Y4Z3_9ACTN|nr:DMT family transporter [Iamia majanohamensis]WCO66514.1 DMT family transporter [Iamia majanohamensis]
MRREVRGALLLATAGLLWGSTFLVMQRAIETAEPVPFLGARFLIAAAALAPLALRRPSSGGGEVRLGVLAGLVLASAYLLQTFGLRATTTSTSAFVTYLLVVIVPLMVGVTERTWPGRRLVVGVALAVGGLWLLSGSGGDAFDWGEVLTLGCAVAFAGHLVVVGRTTERLDPVRFTFVQVLTVGAVCAVPGLWLGGYDLGAGAWVAALFTGLLATSVAFLCMVAGQRTVPSSRAALILLVEPVSAAVLGVATGEELGWRGLAGAALILAAILTVEVLPLLRGDVTDDPAVEPTVHG